MVKRISRDLGKSVSFDPKRTSTSPHCRSGVVDQVGHCLYWLLAAAFCTHPSKNMTERMKKFAIATMIIALTMFAYSQQGNAQITERTDKEKKADAAIEKAYEDSLKREKSNGPPVKSDPWQTVRPAGGDNTKH
jgi:hypothetical protein